MRKQLWISPSDCVYDLEDRPHAHIFKNAIQEALEAVPHHDRMDELMSSFALVDASWIRICWDSDKKSLSIQCTHKGLAHKALRKMEKIGLYYENLYLDIEKSAFSCALDQRAAELFARRGILPMNK